jgi:hypothetical protein
MQDVIAAGLRIRDRREWPVLPGRCLVVAAWILEPASAGLEATPAAAGRRDA